ncbi:hypothetical protein TEA_018811 [Camellia sinensis var. sinensis]|uniref:Plant heme peroxidase family profile domain-containing protein n=1 Tax=Camellia sinensis var. sinensis TaxID=542762 RepID=A0A4S4DSP0_CAMSN|nr:hypothetical protein TEA_018811 [Camellia sinensis var. sinensis]
MGIVSFISTVPSLPALPPVPSPPTITTSAVPSYPIHASTISCKIEADNASETQFGRRDVLKCFGATIGMEIIASSGSFVEEAYAADLIQRRQRSEFQSNVKVTLSAAIKVNPTMILNDSTDLYGNPDLIPSILTLAVNDAMTYDKATKSGCPNGSIRFRSSNANVQNDPTVLDAWNVDETKLWNMQTMLNCQFHMEILDHGSKISRPENKGLSAALNLLEEAKKEIDLYSKCGPISFADLIQYAGQSAIKSTFLASAIRKCGGNEEKGSLLYTAYGSNGQWGLFDRQFGRFDAQEPDPEGRVPQWEKASVQEMKDKFSAIGLGGQLAVMSAFLGPDQMATETLLATDRDVAPWVEKYQRSRETVSETDYEVDLITTLTKLSALGQQINYEAYAYPVQRVDFSKLKL